MLLKFPTLATSGVNTVVVENGVVQKAYCVPWIHKSESVVKVQTIFLQSLVGNHQQKCLSTSSVSYSLGLVAFVKAKDLVNETKCSVVYCYGSGWIKCIVLQPSQHHLLLR